MSTVSCPRSSGCSAAKRRVWARSSTSFATTPDAQCSLRPVARLRIAAHPIRERVPASPRKLTCHSELSADFPVARTARVFGLLAGLSEPPVHTGGRGRRHCLRHDQSEPCGGHGNVLGLLSDQRHFSWPVGSFALARQHECGTTGDIERKFSSTSAVSTWTRLVCFPWGA